MNSLLSLDFNTSKGPSEKQVRYFKKYKKNSNYDFCNLTLLGVRIYFVHVVFL